VSIPDYELPDDLSPEEEKAVIAALERYFDQTDPTPDAWKMAGRAADARQGPLQMRKIIASSWHSLNRLPIAQRNTPNLHGRGDAK